MIFGGFHMLYMLFLLETLLPGFITKGCLEFILFLCLFFFLPFVLSSVPFPSFPSSFLHLFMSHPSLPLKPSQIVLLQKLFYFLPCLFTQSLDVCLDLHRQTKWKQEEWVLKKFKTSIIHTHLWNTHGRKHTYTYADEYKHTAAASVFRAALSLPPLPAHPHTLSLLFCSLSVVHSITCSLSLFLVSVLSSFSCSLYACISAKVWVFQCGNVASQRQDCLWILVQWWMWDRGSDVHWQRGRTKGRDWKRDQMDFTLPVVSAWSQHITALYRGVDYCLPVSTEAPLDRGEGEPSHVARDEAPCWWEGDAELPLLPLPELLCTHAHTRTHIQRQGCASRDDRCVDAAVREEDLQQGAALAQALADIQGKFDSGAKHLQIPQT